MSIKEKRSALVGSSLSWGGSTIELGGIADCCGASKVAAIIPNDKFSWLAIGATSIPDEDKDYFINKIKIIMKVLKIEGYVIPLSDSGMQ